MQQQFYELSDFIQSKLLPDEHFTCNFVAEDSDFVRVNKGKVRQSGNVWQQSLQLKLIFGNKHVATKMMLTGVGSEDRAQVSNAISALREKLPFLPDDPYLLIAETPDSTADHADNHLIKTPEMVEQIVTAGQGLDMVGILASGGIYRGFSNSYGQRNWFCTHNFNFDWSLVHNANKAVKSTYAGTKWDSEAFTAKMALAKRKLSALQRPAVTLNPGEYRVFLTPEALWEILELLCWGGFSIRSVKSKVSPLIKLVENEESLHKMFSMYENVKDGSSPQFQADGFLRPNRIPLIANGRFVEALVSPRSSKEYNTSTNGASSSESPDSLDVMPGTLKSNQVLQKLETGVHVGNLWYLNYSDRSGCRITGMTRFATFWVENGEVVGPLNVMRFDDTVYRMLGSNLMGLTDERDFLLSASSYHNRSTHSARLPGAMIENFRFTL